MSEGHTTRSNLRHSACTRHDLESGFERRCGTAAHEQRERSRFDDATQVRAEQREVIGPEIERQRRAFPGLQVNPLESDAS
jgi:hypothetical protein